MGLRDIIDIILWGRPSAVPSKIDSTTNYVEHPEVVADRLVRFGSLVGKENVMVGADCGFATFAGHHPVDSNVVWAKF